MSDLISRADAIAYIERVINSGLGRNKSLDYIHKYISALPSAEAEWIPVSERLPDVDVEVLTTTDWSDVLIAWLEKGGAWETEEHILANDEILAWMPLPEPYREDGEE